MKMAYEVQTPSWPMTTPHQAARRAHVPLAKNAISMNSRYSRWEYFGDFFTTGEMFWRVKIKQCIPNPVMHDSTKHEIIPPSQPAFRNPKGNPRRPAPSDDFNKFKNVPPKDTLLLSNMLLPTTACFPPFPRPTSPPSIKGTFSSNDTVSKSFWRAAFISALAIFAKAVCVTSGTNAEPSRRFGVAWTRRHHRLPMLGALHHLHHWLSLRSLLLAREIHILLYHITTTVVIIM